MNALLARVRRFRHAQLLVNLAVLILVRPFVEHTIAEPLLNIVLLLTLVSSVVACATRAPQVVGGVLLSILVFGLAIARDLTGREELSVVASALGTLFFGYVCALVLADVFRAERVSSDKLCGALAVYLLLGVVWAFGYALLESLVPGSIVGVSTKAGDASYDQYLGYSFVTLTTLGYGNVVPVNPRAEIVASAQAVVGQLYLTVLVARLVALNLTAGSDAGLDGD